MIRMCASNSHSYTHLILALGIVREPTGWVFITSEYPGIHELACLLLVILTSKDHLLSLSLVVVQTVQ